MFHDLFATMFNYFYLVCLMLKSFEGQQSKIWKKYRFKNGFNFDKRFFRFLSVNVNAFHLEFLTVHRSWMHLNVPLTFTTVMWAVSTVLDRLWAIKYKKLSWNCHETVRNVGPSETFMLYMMNDLKLLQNHVHASKTNESLGN